MHLVRLIAGYNTDLTPWQDSDLKRVQKQEGENELSEISGRWLPLGRLKATRMC